MRWLDLAVVCLLLWGGVSGCLLGLRKAAWRFGSLIASIFIAAGFQEEVKSYLLHSYPVDYLIKGAIERRLAIPVLGHSTDTAFPNEAIPVVIKQLIEQDPALAAAVSGPAGYAGLLAQFVFNAAAFALGFFFWGGGLYLVTALCGERLKQPHRIGELLGGFLAGTARSCLLLIIAAGLLLPFTILIPFPWELLRLDQGSLFNSALQLFAQMEVWWR